ncbi:hypothetical protein FKP32DRAFT_1711924 [Trametes sanguinea]|nr:hypothetical protein FKP32DRAFT_1711924 [Trametes sanguinea]
MYAYAEIKNELGLDGMCEVQVAATYQWAIALLEYTSIQEASCCPCILVSIAGPYIRFYGAVLTDAFIDAEDRIERVAKIFVEVRNALEELKVWYQGLSIGGGDNRAVPRHILPHPSYARESDRALLSTLEFLDRFDYPGCRRTRGKSELRLDLQPSLFRARLHGEPFCFRYGERAHRVLAAHDPPLAPKLHACVPLVGGPIMVVMNIVPGGKTAWKQYGKTQPLPDPVADNIETALAVLGQQGLVHGDVRRPNVMTVQRADGKTGGMLIGFDWAGKDGEARYPSSLKKDVDWPPGVHPAQPIKFAHDWEMWRALKRGAV